ncbi:hypothetical protein GCM10010517_57630 [Streptosporangium fragile]|uniref:Uncharacterized protein n=2 Tax=Streptosporangium fragile TaxID=46186 RepID=A0ABP6IKQ6_9ACTN
MAVASFLGWTALAVESFITPPPQDYRDALILIPWTLYAIVIVGVHQAQRERTGGFAVIGLVLTLAGMATSAVGNVGVLLGSQAMVAVSFPIGPGLFSLGMLLFGIATFRAGILPRYAGVMLVLAQPLTIGIGVALSWHVPVHPHGSFTGGLGHGITVLMLAIALVRVQRMGEPQQATVPR